MSDISTTAASTYEAPKNAATSRKRPLKWQQAVEFDYKEPTSLYKLLAPGGKIFPARVNKISQAQQRKYCKAVKKARHLALLPIGNYHYDSTGRPQPISPKPLKF